MGRSLLVLSDIRTGGSLQIITLFLNSIFCSEA